MNLPGTAFVTWNFAYVDSISPTDRHLSLLSIEKSLSMISFLIRLASSDAPSVGSYILTLALIKLRRGEIIPTHHRPS